MYPPIRTTPNVHDVALRYLTFVMENAMKHARHPSKSASAAQAAMHMLDEALEETFPASDPIAVTPDASEADLKTRQPRSASRAADDPKSPPRR